MDITYTYTILNVDEANKCMEVLYSSEGLPKMHVGVRIPFVDESLEEVIKMFAPINYWQTYSKEIQAVVSGVTGTIVYSEPIMPTSIEPANQPVSQGTQTL